MSDFPDPGQIYQRFLRDVETNSVDEALAGPHYFKRCQQIRQDARNANKFDFLRWPSLSDFSIPESWIPAECYEELQKNQQWDQRWYPLTRESKIGAPKDFSLDFGTSPILIQHAYHLLRYETTTCKSLLGCDFIFEVGGGYGSFCRLLKNAGFSGLHIIYDLPHTSSIQRLYLTLSRFIEVPYREMARRKEHGFCLVVDENLDETFSFLRSGNYLVGFVATWSLSETSMAVRERIFPRFYPICGQYLIAFQPAWGSINNVEYFSRFAGFRPNLKWFTEEMPRTVPPPSLYLFA
jgi:hypothetical protein